MTLTLIALGLISIALATLGVITLSVVAEHVKRVADVLEKARDEQAATDTTPSVMDQVWETR